MAKKDLLTELKNGYSRFTLVGKAVVKDGALAGASIKEGKTWKQVDSSFGVQTAEGNTVYARIWGGYQIDNPVIKRRSADDGKFFDIKWNDRFDEKIIEKTDKRDSVLRAGFEKDEETDKIITKEFLHEIDFEEYLREHLADGMEVRVSGEAEYGEYNDDTTLRYNIKSVYLAEPYKNKEGELVTPVKEAKLKQTYLLDSDSLDKNWEKQLEKDGEVFVRAFVPQYVGKKKVGDKYVPLKKTVPFMKPFKVKLKNKDSETELAAKKKIIKKFFVGKKNTVRELVAMIDIVDGFSTSTGDIEISPEIQELIDLEIMTLEDVKKQVTVRGSRVSELVFSMPVMKQEKDSTNILILMDDEKYAQEALIAPTVDGEDDEDDDFADATVTVSDDEFNDMFM